MVLFLQKINFITLTVALRFFVKLELIHKENIVSLERPFIVVANHKSYFDHWLICFALVKIMGLQVLPFRFFTADYFFKRWWTGWGLLLKAYGAFPAHKGEGLEVSLKESIEILSKGGAVVFYPEGRAVRDPNVIGEPRRGIGALALWSGAKILPVAIKGSNDMRNGVKITFGKPFLIKGVLDKSSLKGDESDYPMVAGVIMNKVKDLFHGI